MIFDNIEETLEEILFLLNNEDSGFDSKTFRDMLEQNDIITNIKANTHNGNMNITKYFEEELYKRRFKIKKPMSSWIASKPY